MKISDIAAYMEWKDNGMSSRHPWFPIVTDDMSSDAAYHDDTIVLHIPPEYTLPEWDPIPPIDWTETHDWTSDYDYPEDYFPEYEEEDE